MRPKFQLPAIFSLVFFLGIDPILYMKVFMGIKEGYRQLALHPPPTENPVQRTSHNRLILPGYNGMIILKGTD